MISKIHTSYARLIDKNHIFSYQAQALPEFINFSGLKYVKMIDCLAAFGNLHEFETTSFYILGHLCRWA